MNTRSLLSLLLLIPMVIGGFTSKQPAAPAQVGPLATNTDIAIHGTAWTAETRGKLAMNKPYGWGTAYRAKAAGYQWVHIPFVYTTVTSGTALNLTYMEFCAQSSHGAATKPVQADAWEYAGKFYTSAISWPADNAKHCWGASLSVPAWHQDAGLSVRLYFANSTDVITMYKAWIRLEP